MTGDRRVPVEPGGCWHVLIILATGEYGVGAWICTLPRIPVDTSGLVPNAPRGSEIRDSARFAQGFMHPPLLWSPTDPVQDPFFEQPAPIPDGRGADARRPDQPSQSSDPVRDVEKHTTAKKVVDPRHYSPMLCFSETRETT